MQTQQTHNPLSIKEEIFGEAVKLLGASGTPLEYRLRQTCESFRVLKSLPPQPPGRLSELKEASLAVKDAALSLTEALTKLHSLLPRFEQAKHLSPMIRDLLVVGTDLVDLHNEDNRWSIWLKLLPDFADAVPHAFFDIFDEDKGGIPLTDRLHERPEKAFIVNLAVIWVRSGKTLSQKDDSCFAQFVRFSFQSVTGNETLDGQRRLLKYAIDKKLAISLRAESLDEGGENPESYGLLDLAELVGADRVLAISLLHDMHRLRFNTVAKKPTKKRIRRSNIR